MTFRDAADIWVPLLAATLGLLPYLMERRRRRQLEDNQRRRVWADVSKVRGLMADVEKDEQPGQAPCKPPANCRTRSVICCLRRALQSPSSISASCESGELRVV